MKALEREEVLAAKPLPIRVQELYTSKDVSILFTEFVDL
jgi:hypothetical protein